MATQIKAKAQPNVKAQQTSRIASDGRHEGYLRYAGFRWLKIAVILSLLMIVSYFMVDVRPRHNGGSWYGYTLGTIGVLIILWLTMLGIRKRTMSNRHWSLKAWTSAHVYLGLSLLVIGTLHTGFQLGWNVHTLSYVLMMLVILSGIWGISVYATLPRVMSANRDQTTETQMLASLRSIDRQLHDAAQPLDQYYAELVQSSLQQNPFGGGIFSRLSNQYPRCKTRKSHAEFMDITGGSPQVGEDPMEKVNSLLGRKKAILARTRKHLQLKALLEIWLYIHVPLTFALIAALSAHIVSVFFYW
jgi:hypothetical protein